MKKIFVVLCFLTVHLQADYVYPLKAKPGFSSNFGEFRSNHFHEGIDFRVYGKMGVPALAIQDGYISRIRVLANGYGKMVYLKMNDGRQALYAHNHAFADGLAKIVETEQTAQEIYSVDITLSPARYPIKAGDIIAYAGNTGTVAPHLHFEILDSLDQPINPLLTNLADYFQDHIPPQIRTIFLIPLSATSRINDLPGSFSFTKLPLKDSLRLTGNWGLEIEAKDRYDTYHNPINIYEKILILDTDTIYHYRFDILNKAMRYQVHIDYNNESYTRNNAHYQRLYRFSAKFDWDRDPKSGIIKTSQIKPGNHTLKIIIKDIYQNTSQTELSFYSEQHRKSPEITDWSYDKPAVRFNYILPAYVDLKAFIYDKVTGKEGVWGGYRSNLLDQNQNLWQAGGIIPQKNTTSDRYLLHLVFTNQQARVINQYYYPLKSVSDPSPTPDNSKLKPTFTILPTSHYLRIELTSNLPIYQTLGRLNDTQRIQGICQGVKSAYYLMDYAQLHNGTNSLWLEQNNILIQWSNQMINPTHSSILYSPDSLLEIEVTEKSATNLAAVFSRTFPAKAYSIPSGMIPCSPVYSFEPRYEIFSAPLKIKIKSVPQEKVGLYRISGGHLNYLGNERNENYYQGTYNRLSNFILLKDTQKPSLRFINLKKGKMKKNNVMLKISINDIGSGLSNQGIRCKLDQQPVICEWDGVRHLLIFKPQSPVHIGKHVFSVSLTDLAGNTNAQKVTFQVY